MQYFFLSALVTKLTFLLKLMPDNFKITGISFWGNKASRLFLKNLLFVF